MIHQVTIPGPRGLPVIGKVSDLLCMRHNRLNFIMKVSREYGRIGYLHFPQHAVLINSADLAHSVLVEHAYEFEKASLSRGVVGIVLGNGLFTSKTEFHKRQRRLIAPAFQHGHITIYAEIIAHFAACIQNEWADGTTIDITHEMMRLTLWIIGKTLFDAEVLSEAEEVSDALNCAIKYAIAQRNSLLRLPFAWRTPSSQSFRHALSRLDEIVHRMIIERRHSNQDRGDLLSMLLQARNEDDGSFMTDTQVRDEVMSLLLGGHDTMTNALTWTWYLLARHSEAYTKMCEEVDQVLAGRAPTAIDLPNLPYTLQVLKEALRLYSPSYIIARQALVSVNLGDYHLPAGTIAIISPYALHRKSEYFPEPELFHPKRFALEATHQLRDHAYMPFGDGPRNCIGKHFALMQGQIILAVLAQYVRFELVDGQRIEPEPLITLRPRNGVKVIVRRRERPNTKSLFQ